MAKKKYSPVEKLKYHEERGQKMRTSNKGWYSREWVSGYNDPYADNNIDAARAEIAQKKSQGVPNKRLIGLYGYLNGAKAKLSQKNR